MFGLPKSGDGTALDRLGRFFAARGIDMDRLRRRSIVVTGSNGKGSTARQITGALSALGFKVGCFTSPHLFEVRERFALDGALIPQAAFDRLAGTVLDYNATLPDGDRIGAFEALFMIAALWFEEEPCDAIVWEAGIGGRYDPVRTVGAGVSTLTSVELEHTELLGPTEELIAYDKIDALAPGGTLVVSPSVRPQLTQRIVNYCKLTNRTPRFVADTFRASAVTCVETGTHFRLEGLGETARDARISLIGQHQVDNALTALLAAQAWCGSLCNAETMLAGVAATRWPGRLERISKAPDAWIDVGHTPGAVDCVTRSWAEFRDPAKTLLVFGVSHSKEVQTIAALAAARFPRAILTRAHKAGTDPAVYAPAFSGRDASLIPDIAEASRAARIAASQSAISVLAIGGLFLAVEFQHAWSGGDPRTLDFF